jgi:hypothetical protein
LMERSQLVEKHGNSGFLVGSERGLCPRTPRI